MWTHAEQIFPTLVVGAQNIVNWAGGASAGGFLKALDFDFLPAVPGATVATLNLVCITCAVQVQVRPLTNGKTIYGASQADWNYYPAIEARVLTNQGFISRTCDIRNNLVVLPQLHWVTVGPVIGGYEAGVAPASSSQRVALISGGTYGTRLQLWVKGLYSGRLIWSAFFASAPISTTGYWASCGSESWQG